MSKKSISRKDAESVEGLEQVKNEVPENKMQDEQQIATVSSASRTNGPKSGFTPERKKAAGSQLKQEKISDVLTGAPSDSGMGITMGGRGVSGTANGILGAGNSTPVAEQSRSNSRPGKKLDRIATKLNYTPCEQTFVEFDESKPLADSATEDQGYNGTYRNEFARSQKIAGAVPGDLNFQRSVDLITKDKLYFIEGQMVFQDGDSQTDMYPSLTYNEDIQDYEPYELKLGDYVHKNMHIGLTSQGQVDYLYFDVEDITPTGLTPEEANTASAHKLIKQNVAELDRMVMDTKAGDEKADLWTPLARATKQPTRQSALMSTIEGQTGAYVHLAYSKATTNFSYFLNRAAKDGLDITTPFFEEIQGSYLVDTTSGLYSGNPGDVFTRAEYAKGSPALMIDAYDSKNKYNNKADLLLQPRGWRMHLQTADNNMNPLKVPAEYATVYAGQETFSTIDHEYDGLLPVCMTDKAGLVDPINLNQMCAFYHGATECTTQFTTTAVASSYQYDDKVLVPSFWPFAVYAYYKLLPVGGVTTAHGLTYASNVITVDANGANETRKFSIKLSDHEISAATLADEDSEWYGYIAFNSNNPITGGLSYHCPKVQSGSGTTISAVTYTPSQTKKITPYKGGNFKYMYSDMRNNYIVTVKHPLVQGIIDYLEKSIGAKFKSLLGDNELFIPLVFSTQYMTLAELIICAATPWITRVRVNSMKDVIYYEDNIHEYPYSKLISLKDSPFKNYVNFGYSGYDEPLQSKVMQPANAIQWVLPEFFWKINGDSVNTYVCPWYFNEEELKDYDSSAMSFPSIRSGVRLGSFDILYGMSEKDVRLSLDRMTKALFTRNSNKLAATGAYKYGRTTDGQPFIQLATNTDITIYDVLSCPRELGLCMDAPIGVLSCDPTDNTVVDGVVTTSVRKAFTSSGVGSSFIIKCWMNPDSYAHPSILNSKGVNIHRAANYIQKWIAIYANEDAANSDVNGLVFGLNDEGTGQFSPFIGLSDTALDNAGPTIVSYQRSLWTRLQMLPFVISPFDGVGSTNSAKRDIYDLAYMFGLAGFRASDYRESVYNREKEVVNQGFLFVSDPWVLDSSIIKHGASSTGIVNTKGFALRKN